MTKPIYPRIKERRRLLRTASGLMLGGVLSSRWPSARSIESTPAECIVPAKSGGGFDLSCQAAKRLLDQSGLLPVPVQVRYIPGGIGAIVYNQVVSKAPNRPEQLIAFSGGSLLNIAQGKFGPHTEANVRWVASIAMDYGVVAVRKHSHIRSLQDLISTMRAKPMDIVFGAGGTIGSQDWVKSAEIARAAQSDFKLIRYVAFEGGGDAISALEGGYVDVVPGDAAELTMHLNRGADVRVIAALSEERLPGILSSVPTAREQGFDISWPIIRGFYVGPRVSNAHYDRWVSVFQRLVELPGYRDHIIENGMQPYFLAGGDLTRYVVRQVGAYREVARRYKLL